jgi:hypothetical protein
MMKVLFRQAFGGLLRRQFVAPSILSAQEVELAQQGGLAERLKHH